MTAPPATPREIVQWSNVAFARITQIASARAGLAFPENRREITESALLRAMAHAGEKNADAFAERVAREPEVYAAALTELTVGETYFFRDPAQWDLVRKEIVPELMRVHQDGRGVRAWSAGCASGEEAYTLGIVLRESGCIAAAVMGTDLCQHRLARASRAVYTKWSLRGVDEAARQRYFHESAQYFHLLPQLRDVRFRPVNLVGGEYGADGQELSELDVILCRNVLIYIEPDVVASIFERLASALREGGWLMLAASDPQPRADLPLDVVVTESGLLYRKRTTGSRSARAAAREAFPSPAPRTPALVAPRSSSRTPARPSRRIPAALADAPPPVSGAEQAMRAYRVADYDQAVAFAGTIVAAGRDTAATWVLLARSHANRGDLSQAARACALGLARYPAAGELHVVESAIESQRERFAAAAEAARRALYVDRTLVVAHVALGTALLRAGDTTAADRSLRSAERMLASLGPRDIVPASDGVSAFDLLSAVKAHRALLVVGGSHAG